MTTPPSIEADLPSNWGRWADDDQLGTLNFINGAARARGVAQAREGRVVSLARPVDPVPLAAPFPFAPTGMPTAVLQMINFTGSPARAMTDVLVINTHHVGLTHIDALVHVPVEEKVYPGVPLGEAAGFGVVRHGSTSAFVDGLVTRGVILDLAPGGSLESDHPVTGADLDEAERRGQVQVESGDALVVRSAWVNADHPTEPAPWMSVDAVRWLGEREVSLYVGEVADKFNPLGPGIPMPLHQVALPRLGMPLIDNADISGLWATAEELARRTFLLVVGVVPIRGATGLPINPLAIF
jgi:kynurenine formamidase